MNKPPIPKGWRPMRDDEIIRAEDAYFTFFFGRWDGPIKARYERIGETLSYSRDAHHGITENVCYAKKDTGPRQGSISEIFSLPVPLP